MGYLTGAGSDYAAFVHYLGITSVDMSYTYDRVWKWFSSWKPVLVLYRVSNHTILFLQRKTSARIYPAYHTAYDTFDYCSKYIDPGG